MSKIHRAKRTNLDWRNYRQKVQDAIKAKGLQRQKDFIDHFEALKEADPEAWPEGFNPRTAAIWFFNQYSRTGIYLHIKYVLDELNKLPDVKPVKPRARITDLRRQRLDALLQEKEYSAATLFEYMQELGNVPEGLTLSKLQRFLRGSDGYVGADRTYLAYTYSVLRSAPVKTRKARPIKLVSRKEPAVGPKTKILG